MIIDKAKPEESNAIARFVAMAEGELVPFLVGEKEHGKAVGALEEYILSPEPNRYQLENCTVARLDGQTGGMILSFAADDQPVLDRPILRDLRSRGVELDALTFEGEPGSYYLSTMAVDPAFRGKGIGSALLEGALGRGRGRGFGRASLLVSLDKPRAQALYERLGFAVLQPLTIGRNHYVRMTKEL